MSFRSVQFQLVYAFLGFLLSFIVSFVLYSEMIRGMRGQEHPVQIALGKHSYLIKNPAGKCMGWLHYEVEQEGGYSFIIENSMLYSRLGKNQEVKVSCGISFNSLNQLSGTYMKILQGSDELRVQTAGVQKLNITVEGTFQGEKRQFSHSIPGPIELHERQNGEFVVKAPNAPFLGKISEFEDLPVGLSTLPFELMPLSLDQENQPGGNEREQLLKALREQCFMDEVYYFDIDPYLKLLSKIGGLP